MPDLQNLRQKGFEPRRKENDKTSAFLPFLCVWRVKGNVRVSVLSLQSLALYNSLGNFVKTVNKWGIFQNDVYDNVLLASEIYIQQCALFRLIMVILELPKGFPPKKKLNISLPVFECCCSRKLRVLIQQSSSSPEIHQQLFHLLVLRVINLI